MTVENDKELEDLKKVGRVVGLTLKEMERKLKPGMTTAELDFIGQKMLAKFGARSAPNLTYGFPGATCISINNEAAHGIPGNRAIKKGDLVNIDVSAELDGFFADAATTIMVPPISALARKLIKCTLRARKRAIQIAQAGKPLNLIGKTIESEAKRCGFTVIRDLPGHGVGRALHEDPTIPGYYDAKLVKPLKKGQVITIEPFLADGAHHIQEAEDGFTLKTTNGRLSAQFEHTIVVTMGKPIIITAV
ncbi:MAG: type I methionyl aminopeptidase [Chloroflexota bacterium]